MKLSGYKTLERQQTLWPDPLGNHGHSRHVLGNLFEELTAALVGGRRHKTDSRCDYCPDVSAGGIYYESKGAGRNGETFVYSGRLEKDREFAREHSLVYCVWSHRASVLGCSTVAELEARVLGDLRAVYLVPFGALDMLCSGLRTEPLNSAYGKGHQGKGSKVYGSGKRIRLALLSDYLVLKWDRGQFSRDGWPIR